MKIRFIPISSIALLIVCCINTASIHAGALIEPFLIRQSKIPFTINFPGTYVVIDELDYKPAMGTSGAAITVAADNVHLNFNNRTLVVHNDLVGVRTGILIQNVDNIIVTDPVVTVTNDVMGVGAATIGIDVQGSINATIRRADISGVNNLGSPPYGSTGINMVGSENCEFIDVLTQSCLNGVVLTGCVDMAFQSVNIESAGSGVTLNNCNRIAFHNCVTHDINAISYLIDGASTDIVLDHCESLRSLDDGISIQGSTRCIVRNCVVSFANYTNAVGTAGIFIDNFSTSNIIAGCIINGGMRVGIENQGGITNRIYNCIAENNSGGNLGVGVTLQAVGDGNIQFATTNFWINVARN